MLSWVWFLLLWIGLGTGKMFLPWKTNNRMTGKGKIVFAIIFFGIFKYTGR
jgi:hypothetical protein